MEHQCPYADNAFCSGLSGEQRAVLCRRCHVRKYAARQQYDTAYWTKGPVLLLDGLLLMGNDLSPSDETFRSREYAEPGGFVTLGDVVIPAHDYPQINSMLCMTDCWLALFDSADFDELYRTDIDFCHQVMRTVTRGWGLAEAHLVADTAARKIELFLKFCARNDFPRFTHEQIALACNLSRQTVTKTLGELLRENSRLYDCIA